MTGRQRLLAIAVVVAYGDVGRALFENTLDEMKKKVPGMPDTWEKLSLDSQMHYIHRALALTAE